MILNTNHLEQNLLIMYHQVRKKKLLQKFSQFVAKAM